MKTCIQMIGLLALMATLLLLSAIGSGGEGWLSWLVAIPAAVAYELIVAWIYKTPGKVSSPQASIRSTK